MSVAEWADTYGIHHWRILWSSYRKLAWVGFEPTTTESLILIVTNTAAWNHTVKLTLELHEKNIICQNMSKAVIFYSKLNFDHKLWSKYFKPFLNSIKY